MKRSLKIICLGVVTVVYKNARVLAKLGLLFFIGGLFKIRTDNMLLYGRRWLTMKVFLWIIGIILALPILLTLVALIVVTLIGGYITAILYWGWWIVVSILLIILIVKLIRYYL